MIDQDIAGVMQRAIREHVFPGGTVGYITEGTTAILPFGQLTYEEQSRPVTKDTVYDLASVTKAIPTTSITLKLIEDGKLSADDRVIKFIPELSMLGKETILIRHLMTFTVTLDMGGRLSELSGHGVEAVFDKLFQAPLKHPAGTQYLYSNPPIVLLGIIIERVTGRPLDQVADEMFFGPLGMKHTTFHPETLKAANIAPTEINDRGLVQGKPHDETAWAFYQEGKVAAHAGLFSCAQDLLTFGQMLLNDGVLDGKRYFSAQTMSKIKTEIVNDGEFGMSLGWETSQTDYMSPKNSPKVYGKDGFTGTLILMEPDKKRCLVMLTNRTYPHRPPSPEPIKSVARQLQDIVIN
jgi:CubicO group peptidase (beta-lactamase class C family)